MPKDAAICKSMRGFLSDLCKHSALPPAYLCAMTGTGKRDTVLKPVLIGFILGMALVGASRLASNEADGRQLASTHARQGARGAAIGHVAAPIDCGWTARPILA